MRVHIYQARNLPAFDESGVLDPYVKVRFNGLKGKSKTKTGTCDPCWFESIELDDLKDGLILPDDLDFAPEIVGELGSRF